MNKTRKINALVDSDCCSILYVRSFVCLCVLSVLICCT